MATGPDLPDDGSRRDALLARALHLSYFSVGWGLIAGAWSVTSGLLAGSLGVLGLGLNVLADVAGSVGLIWRFRAERRDPALGRRAEARASLIVAGALSAVAVVLAVAAISSLIAGTAAQRSVDAMVASVVSAIVLAPLGVAKRRTGTAYHSHALRGDGTLSAIGAALGVLALLGLVVDSAFGWWWADRCAALVVACVAVVEAFRVLRTRRALLRGED